MDQGRDHALDGLRGIAAAFVVLSHVAAMTWVPFYDKGGPQPWQWALWNLGAPSVDLFFALSGYVVARSLLARDRGYGDFVLSRLIRLYPIAFAGLCVGLLLRALDLHPPAGATVGLHSLSEPLTRGDVIGLATLLAPIPDVAKINPPLWSMVVEMQAVLLMPAFALAARRQPLPLVLFALFVPFALAAATNIAQPVYFVGFMLGAVLAAVEDRIPQAPRPTAVFLFFLAGLLCRHPLSSDEPSLRIPCAFAAAGLILAVRQGAARSMLQSQAVQFLGRISYPLYAVHWPIMAIAVMTAGAGLGIAGAALLSIPASVLLALALERVVDRPAVRLSHLVSVR